MSPNLNDASDSQGRETEAGHARPMNPLLSGRLGRLSGIGTSSPFRSAGGQGELSVFLIIFAILVSTFIGSVTQNLLIGIVSFFVVIAMGVGINFLLKRLRSR